MRLHPYELPPGDISGTRLRRQDASCDMAIRMYLRSFLPYSLDENVRRLRWKRR